MPVFFYIDPEFAEDPHMLKVRSVRMMRQSVAILTVLSVQFRTADFKY